MGNFGDAIARLRDCLALAEKSREFYYVPELKRLLGTYLLEQSRDAVGEAEPCFREAITLARKQGARMPELRATMALCRLLRVRGEIDEARTMLEEIYGWFTEGFEISDLKEARALLAELGHSGADSPSRPAA